MALDRAIHKELISGDSRLSIQGRSMFISSPVITFLQLFPLKLRVCMQKILGLAMPKHASTFHLQLIFAPPLKLPIKSSVLIFSKV